MRIVAIADTHTYERKLRTVPDGDLLIHAGDMLRRGTLHELALFSAWLQTLPHTHKVVVAGNDDRCFLQDQDEALEILGSEVVYLQDNGHIIHGLRLWGSPWQPDYKDGAFNLPRGAALRDKWALIPEGIDVLITHGPPRAIGDRSLSGSIGCDDLRAAVHALHPILHLFGHVHGDGGFWREGGVCFANVTTWSGRRPATVLDVDLSTKVVTEVVVPPADQAG
jgi:Icc-related predicted phosphoesterase